MKLKKSLLLLLAATIWGVAFVAQRVGMDYVGPFTFNGVRSLIGAAVLVPVAAVRCRGKEKGASGGRALLTGGLLCGLALFFASSCQQIGLQYTTAGKAGFITAFYIVLVPVFSLFLGKRCPALVWLSVALAIVGLYFLCVGEGFSVGRGDLWVLACAALFAVHILVIDRFAPRTDPVALSCVQFFVCGALGVLVMFWTETPTWVALRAAAVPILYAGALSCGVAYTLQIAGQRDMNPTVASLLLSMESCVSVLAGWAILGQALSARELGGCGLMLLAVVLAQLPEPRKTKKNNLEEK